MTSYEADSYMEHCLTHDPIAVVEQEGSGS